MADEQVVERKRPVDTGAQQADIAAANAAAEEAKVAKKAQEPAPKVEGEAPKGPSADTKGDDDGQSAGEQGAQQPDAEDDVPRGVKRRLDKLTRRVYERDERINALTAELEQLRKVPTATPQTPQVPDQSGDRPTLESCGMDPERYLEAVAEWKLEQRLKSDAEQRKQREAESEKQKKVGAHKEREQSFADAHPDYYEKAYTAPVNYSPSMLDFISESEHGPAIAYYLADHLDEAKAIEMLPPMRQAVALDRIERAIAPSQEADPEPAQTQRPVKTVTPLPAPPATVAASGTPRKSASDPGLSTAERIAIWRKQRGR